MYILKNSQKIQTSLKGFSMKKGTEGTCQNQSQCPGAYASTGEKAEYLRTAGGSIHQRADAARPEALNADKAKEQDVVFLKNSV